MFSCYSRQVITTLTGSNTYVLKAAQKSLVQAFVEKNGEFGLERFSGEDGYDKILQSVQAVPFLAPARMVVVTDIVASKQLVESIDVLLGAINPETDVVFVEPKLDKRTVLYKTLKKTTEFRECNELDERALAQWLVQEASQAGGVISRTDAAYLVYQAGTDQSRLGNELEKLLLYDPNVTKQTIDLLVEPSPQSTVFALLDEAFSGNAARTLAIYQDQRKQRTEPQAILAMLGWQLHVLCLVKTAGNESVEHISKAAKLNPFVVRKSQAITRKLHLVALKRLVHDVVELDVRLKTVSTDADEAVQTFLLTVASATS